MRAARPAGAAALAVAALVLGGCGEDRGESASTETTAPPLATEPRPAPPEAPPARVRVRESEYRIDPAQIRVDRPATLDIRVRNAGSERHALAVEAPAGEVRTRVLAAGDAEALRVELDRPGRYRWYCPVDGHARRGMRGTIAVAPPGG